MDMGCLSDAVTFWGVPIVAFFIAFVLSKFFS
jgi:hypothetical protein